MAFLLMTKSFDSINGQAQALWTMDPQKTWCPHKLIVIIRPFHKDVQAMGLRNERVTRPFNVRAGVKQVCVLALTLFSVFSTAVPSVSTGKLPVGVQYAE